MTQNTAHSIDPAAVQRVLAKHLPIYHENAPTYQALMLDSLRELWVARHRSVLDVGGGTGVIAEAISTLFPVDEVRAIDVVDRFCPSLSVPTQKYDGRTLPFDCCSFDAATLINVMHHVPLAARVDLLREIRRVVDGPVYIKDHETCGRVDNIRLIVLDAIGNIPFGGMVWARYLSRCDWEELAQQAGYRVAAHAKPARYRHGVFARMFPNGLEVTMRLEPA